MYASMIYRTAPFNECLHNYSIATTMYALMCYQICLFTECLITHLTGVTALTAMYVLMFYQTALLNEFLFTHKYDGPHCYVCVGGFSDSSVE